MADAPWFNTNFEHRKKITITNNDSVTLVVNTIVEFVQDTAALITAGKLRSDGKDYRVVFWNGSTNTEIARDIYDAFNTSATLVWFRLQAAITASGTDDEYYIYYDFPTESTSAATLGLSVALLEENTSGKNQTASGIDVTDGDEWGAATRIAHAPSNTSWYIIDNWDFFVSSKNGSGTHKYRPLIVQAVDKREGDEISNSLGSLFSHDDLVDDDFRTVQYSIPQPRLERSETFYAVIVPSAPAGRTADGDWFRWDFANNVNFGDDNAFNVPRTAVWNQNWTDGEEHLIKIFGHEAPNDNGDFALAAEENVPTDGFRFVTIAPVSGNSAKGRWKYDNVKKAHLFQASTDGGSSFITLAHIDSTGRHDGAP